MNVFFTKTRRLLHAFCYRLTAAAPVAVPFVLTTAVSVALIFGVAMMEKGAFSYCTRELVTCLETGATRQGAFSRGVSVLSCAFKTVACDAQTVWFALMDDVAPSETEPDLLDTPVVLEPISQDEASSLPKVTESGEELKKTMEKLRREREFFEKNQREIREQLFKALEKD